MYETGQEEMWCSDCHDWAISYYEEETCIMCSDPIEDAMNGLCEYHSKHRIGCKNCDRTVYAPGAYCRPCSRIDQHGYSFQQWCDRYGASVEDLKPKA